MDGPAPTATHTRGVKGLLTGEAASSGTGSGEAFIPLHYREETVQLVKLAGPVVRLSALVTGLKSNQLLF